MEEIQPGLLHWTAFRTTIGADVHSYLHTPSGTLIDPMEPLQGLEAVPPVERIVLTNRHHYRHSDRFREAFGCQVLCQESGLHEFEGGPEVTRLYRDRVRGEGAMSVWLALIGDLARTAPKEQLATLVVRPREASARVRSIASSVGITGLKGPGRF